MSGEPSVSQALGMDSVMGRVTLNHLSVLQNEENGCRQAGTPVRRQPRRMPAITSHYFLRLFCFKYSYSQSEIYTQWLQPHEVTSISSPLSLGLSARWSRRRQLPGALKILTSSTCFCEVCGAACAGLLYAYWSHSLSSQAVTFAFSEQCLDC